MTMHSQTGIPAKKSITGNPQVLGISINTNLLVGAFGKRPSPLFSKWHSEYKSNTVGENLSLTSSLGSPRSALQEEFREGHYHAIHPCSTTFHIFKQTKNTSALS